MEIEIIPVTPFEQNCSFIVCPVTKKAALIDPGGDIDQLEAVVAQSGAQLEKSFLRMGTSITAARLAFSLVVLVCHLKDLIRMMPFGLTNCPRSQKCLASPSYSLLGQTGGSLMEKR